MNIKKISMKPPNLFHISATLSWLAIIGTLGAWERGTITTTHFIIQFALSVIAAVVFGLMSRKEGKNKNEL